MDYKASGVDIDAGNEAVRRIRSLARGTFTPGVLSDIGSFGGLFRLDRDRYQEPVLVSSADGVGTKLKVAFMTGRHGTVGADLVNHCVNDILVQGAEPLFFLDYLATGRLDPAVAEEVVGGIAGACRENGCALLGGETAEMPGFYADGEYDIAGFIVGIVERSRVIDGRSIVPGDVLIGLPSAGLHTNGYSLARRVLFETTGWTADTVVPELGARLETRCWRRTARIFRWCGRCSRADAQGTGAYHRRRHHREPSARVARRVQCRDRSARVERAGAVSAAAGARPEFPGDEMFRAFNMGIGLVLVCAPTRNRANHRHPGSQRRAPCGQDRVRRLRLSRGDLRLAAGSEC